MNNTIYKIIDQKKNQQVGRDYQAHEHHLALNKADKLDIQCKEVRYVVETFLKQETKH